MRSLRIAVRRLLREPILSGGILLNFTLGIGATVAVYSVLHSVLLTPLPYPESDQLVMVWTADKERDRLFGRASPADFLDWREASSSFTDMACYLDVVRELDVFAGAEPLPVRAAHVFGNFFSVMETEPFLGRGFHEEESWFDRAWVTVLSYGLWQRLGADPNILGREIRIYGVDHIVVGVMPAGFAFPFQDLDLWIPSRWQPAHRERMFFRRGRSFRVVGRLEPGVSYQQAREELRTVAATLERRHPETNEHLTADLTPLREWITGEVEEPLLALWGAAVLVLLLAAANATGLQLARTTAREGELALRSALGASKTRQLWLHLREIALLGLVGGASGAYLALEGIPLLLHLGPPTLLREPEVPLSWPVLGVALGASALVVLGAGLWPAWRSLRTHPSEALGEGTGAGSPRRGSRRLWGALVVSQIAMAMVLAVGSVLLVRSVVALERTDPGFQPESILTVGLSLPTTRYGEAPDRTLFYRRLQEGLVGLPRVESVGLADVAPFGAAQPGGLLVEGEGMEQSGDTLEVVRRLVAPGYFRTLGVPLLEGRDLSDLGPSEGPREIVINETLARKLSPQRSPLGRRLLLRLDVDREPTWRTVVGVVRDQKQRSLREAPQPEVFVSYLEAPPHAARLLLRTKHHDPKTLTQAVRRLVRRLDQELPLQEVTRLDELLAGSIRNEHFFTLLLGLFAVCAVLVAALGILAMTAYTSALRQREIGIRLALGATRVRVLRTVLQKAMLYVSLGLVLGGFGAILGSRFLESLLFDISSLDPLAFLIASVVVFVLCLLVSAWPAYLTSGTDPVEALRRP